MGLEATSTQGASERRRRHMGRTMQAKTAGAPEMHAARGGGEEEATDDRGRAKSEAPDLGLAVWQNEAHRKQRVIGVPEFPIWGSNP